MKKPIEPIRFVLHVMVGDKLTDQRFDTMALRDAAWKKYQKKNPGKPTWRTQTRRTA